MNQLLQTSRKKFLTIFAAATAFIITIVLLLTNTSLGHSLFSARGGETEYSLILDSSNKVTSSGDVVQKTKLGNDVTFTYSGVNSSTTGHATLTNGGTITNKEWLRSISSVKAVFSADTLGASLKFKSSYGGDVWNDEAAMDTGVVYNLGSYPYYLKFTAYGAITISSIEIKYTCVTNPSAHEGEEPGADEWVLATSIEVGDKVAIVTEFDTEKVKTNNYQLTSISTTGTKYGVGDDYSSKPTSFAYPFIVESGTEEGSFAFKNSSNNYLYWSSGNSLNVNSNKTSNSSWKVEFKNNSENAVVTNVQTSSRQIWWNNSAPRFACYENKNTDDESSYKYLSFYKFVAGSIHYDEPDAFETGFTVTYSENIDEGNSFAEAGNVIVTAHKNDGSSSDVTSLADIKVYNYLGYEINQTQTFSYSTNNPQSNKYLLHVEYNNHIPFEGNVNVGRVQYVVGIENTLDDLTLNTSKKMSDYIEDHFSIALSFKYSDDDTSGIRYSGISDYSAYGLSVTLLNPSGQTYSMTTAFGTAGEWTLRTTVHNGTVVDESKFTVDAIPVETVTVSGSSTEVEEGKSIDLEVSVYPSDATNKVVAWSSSNESVATVNSNGRVTGVAVGTAVITATAQDGSAVFGSISVTVTESTTPTSWDLVTSENQLSAGDTFLVGNSSFGKIAKNTTNSGNNVKYIETVAATFSTNSSGDAYLPYALIPSDSQIFTLAGSSGAWQIKNQSNQYLNCTAVKNVGWSSSSYTWSTNLYDGKLYFVSASPSTTGSLIYNNNTSGSTGARITTYSNMNTQYDMYFAEIYKASSAKPIYADSISLSGTQAITVGNTTTINVTYINNNGGTVNQKSTTWSSSNTSVATVSNGIVTGVSAGTATITATVLGKNNVEISNTIQITVSNVAVSSVSLNKDSISIKEGATSTLVATISPSNAYDKAVTWSTSNSSVATVSSGVVTAVSAGTAIITVTTHDGNKTATCTVTVTSSSGGGGTSQWELVTDASSLNDGDVIVFGSASNAATAGDIGSQIMASCSSTFENGYITTLDESTVELTLEASGSNWKLKNNDGQYLGATAVKKLAWDDGVQTWTISISSGSATIQSTTESYGRFLYNVGNPRFTTYTSNTTASMVLPEIYRGGTAEPISPTAITLSSSSLELVKGQSKDLTVTYTPAKANTNKEITWTSSNTNVATVSNGLVTAKSTASAGSTATITARLTNVPAASPVTCTVTVSEKQNSAWTIMIYMCGADLESDYADNTNYDGVGLATGDLNEICSVKNQPNDINMIVETGGSTKWTSSKYGGYNISTTKLSRYHVANKTMVLDSTLDYASMGDVSTFQSFLEWGLNEYPADKVGVVLWNHGGAMRGVCYDEKAYDDCLLTNEVETAVSGALSNCGMAGQKLEFIGYDACLMQVQDIATRNADYFNYMIASEESEAGYGWDYDTWVDDLYSKKSTTTILKAIVDGFIADNGGTGDSENDQTLSYLNLSYTAAYIEAWNAMSVQLGTKITDNNKSSFNSLVTSCKHYGDTSYTSYGTFDAKDFINKLKSNSTFNPGSTYTSNVLTAFNNLVAYSSCGPAAGNSNGLCMFWSCNSKCSKGTYYKANMTKLDDWRTLVTTYGN